MFVIIHGGKIYVSSHIETDSGYEPRFKALSCDVGSLLVTNAKSYALRNYLEKGRKGLIGASGTLRGILIGAGNLIHSISVTLDADGKIEQEHCMTMYLETEGEKFSEHYKEFSLVISHRSEISDYLGIPLQLGYSIEQVLEAGKKSSIVQTGIAGDYVLSKAKDLKEELAFFKNHHPLKIPT